MKTLLLVTLTLAAVCSAIVQAAGLGLTLPHPYQHLFLQRKPVTYVVQTDPAVRILGANHVPTENATDLLTRGPSVVPLTYLVQTASGVRILTANNVSDENATSVLTTNVGGFPLTYLFHYVPTVQIINTNGVPAGNDTSGLTSQLNATTTKLSATPVIYHNVAFHPLVLNPYRRLFYTFHPVVVGQVPTTPDKNAEGEKENNVDKTQPSASEKIETVTGTGKEMEAEA